MDKSTSSRSRGPGASVFTFLFPLLHFASGLSRGKVLLGDAFPFALPKVRKWSPVLSFARESKAKNRREEEKSGKYSKEKA